MLRHEDAQTRLATFRIVDLNKQRFDRVQKLSDRCALVGRALLDLDEKGESLDWQKRQAISAEAQGLFPKLTPRDWKSLFAALFPKLALQVEAGWKLMARLPYTTGGSRRAFRAPGDAVPLVSKRWNWLRILISTLSQYDQDIVWCATWAAYVANYYGDSLGILFAAEIDSGSEQGKQIQTILEESASGQHEIGAMGRHVTRALLISEKPEAWAFVEKLLLAAQRQEGLRQVILETIDETHPEAFKRMLRLILEQNLLRFAACVRAVDVWFGLQWEVLTPAVLRRAIEQALTFLVDEEAKNQALKSATGETYFLALWSVAFHDAHEAIKIAAAAASDENLERRFAAVRLLNELQLDAAREALPKFLDDADLRVSLSALSGCVNRPELFERLEKLLPTLPKKYTLLAPLIWPWASTYVGPNYIADRLVECLGKRPVTTLISFLPSMTGSGKRKTIELLKKQKRWDKTTRDALLTLVGDKENYVRAEALKALEGGSVDEEDAARLEGLLTRKNSDLRRGVLGMLRHQKLPLVLKSADRLLASKKFPQRIAALDLLSMLTVDNQAVKECQSRVEEYCNKYPQPTPEELSPIETVREAGKPRPTLDDGLGLFDPARVAKRITPKVKKIPCMTKAALACITSLEELIAKKADTPLTIVRTDGPTEILLGNIHYWAFPDPDPSKPHEEELAKLPLPDLWKSWSEERSKNQRDKDGYELLRAHAFLGLVNDYWGSRQLREAKSEWADLRTYITGSLEFPSVRYGWIVQKILTWMIYLNPPEDPGRYMLDTLETVFALIPEQILNLAPGDQGYTDWRYTYSYTPPNLWMSRAQALNFLLNHRLSTRDRGRWWELLHWRDQPHPKLPRSRPDLQWLLAAIQHGTATQTDLYEHLIGPSNDFRDLGRLTARVPSEDLKKYPELVEPVERCRQRVIEVELARGENPTASSYAARALQAVFGLDLLIRLLAALGTRPFSTRPTTGRPEVFTEMIECCFPVEGDTHEAFAERIKEAKLSQQQLLQLGLLAPQWLPHVEHTLGWTGLREAYWWIVAHLGYHAQGYTLSLDGALASGAQPGKLWEQLTRERSVLTSQQISEGQYDVSWFTRVHATLGRKRWEQLLEAMKLPSGGASLKKVVYASEVILGRAKKNDIVQRVREKFSREAVRLLGLLPIASGSKGESDLQGRYRVLMAYRRYARSLSPMGQEGALRDLAIGLGNLARTAGFPDPTRMEWALEAKEIADLAAGPVIVRHKDLSVQLRLTENNQPEVTVKRGDRILKSVPADAKKLPKIAALLARQGELRRQASRVKQSLEAMMVRGEKFLGRELKQLFLHPLLRPLLERLVIVGEGIMGYPVAEGLALADYSGKKEPVKPEETLRLAHAHDLFKSGKWDRWQADCFKAERVQPFKQVFRELYVVTAQEKTDGGASNRYASQQVNNSQAMALWGSRGWNTRDEVSRTFHEEGIIADVSFGYSAGTPSEVAGLTLSAIRFRKRGEWKPMMLEDVPPILFSEVMRDCDLVVSVAHVGGVDPEASASTVQMREALIRETCSVLKIANFQVKGTHILIDGKLGRYSIHLGSGVVHRQPGGHLCIIAVDAQHRGRLFLPFADDDPRTAEVITKVITLARDHEIQDPTILEQLR